jgi:hypothetical protein
LLFATFRDRLWGSKHERFAVEPRPVPWPVKVRYFPTQEWPYPAMLVLAMFSVACTSVTRRPMAGHEGPRPATASGVDAWCSTGAQCCRRRISCMSRTDDDHRLARPYVLAPLALSTFTAGIHIGAWRICLVGVILAIGVSVIARSGLLLLLGGRHGRDRRAAVVALH